MRAVVSMAPRRSMLAPRCSSSFATRSCPPPAATCSSPAPFSASASTCPPFSSHSITGCSSPRAAAPQLRGVLPEQFGSGGVALALGQMQRRVATLVAQLGAGPCLQQLLHALLVALAGGHHQAGQPISLLQVDARLMLEQQAHRGVPVHHRSHHESGTAPGVAQVDAGTALQQLLRHAQVPTSRGRVQQPVPFPV
eukprot:scaffold24538_cov63-Phaeocystis_antarctica.AAC.3